MRMRHLFSTGLIALVLLPAARAEAQVWELARGGYIGIRYDETTTQSNNERATSKVMIKEVSKDSPADKAGLKAGDEILRINDLPASKFTVIARALEEGDTVRLRISRSGKESTVTVIAGKRPSMMVYGNRDMIFHGDSVRVLMRKFLDSARVRLDSLNLPNVYVQREFEGDSAFTFRIGRGMPGFRMDTIVFKGDSSVMRIFRGRPDEVMPRVYELDKDMGPGMIFHSFELGARSVGGAELTEVDPAMKDYFKTDRGLLTLRVAPETPADRAGLQPGDVVLEANDRAVSRVEDLRRIVEANPAGVKLDIIRKGENKSLQLKSRK